MKRRGVALLAAGGIAILIVAGGALEYAHERSMHLSVDTVVSGYYTPTKPIAVTNLTLDRGTYSAGYSVKILFTPHYAGSTLKCDLIDTTGRVSFFTGSERVVTGGHWTTITYGDTFDLPDLTLGFRCSPSSGEGITVVFRSMNLFAAPVASG
jgi:hypothetical protein